MKKILITTFIRAHNYGAVLQAYALQTVLNNKGYDVNFLNYHDKAIEKDYKIIILNFESVIKFVLSIIKCVLFLPRNYIRYKNFKKFEKEKLKIQKLEFSLNSFKEEVGGVYITGSDQIWNSNLTNGLSDVYTLNFGSRNMKRISYAASIGNSMIEEKDKEIYKNKISKIDFISVREESAKKILDSLLQNNEISVVLDPTLLMMKKQWENLLPIIHKKISEKYILAYVVEKNDEYMKIVNFLSKVTGLKVVHFEKINKYDNVLKSAYTEGPLVFIDLIKNAEYVVATSFHATAFSIIFNKKFWIIPHIKTGSRVVDLLKKLGICDRAVYTLDEFKKKDYSQEINYKKVNEILDLEREKSINWLINAIEK